MTLWSSPHPKESAAVSLGQAHQGGEAGKLKELTDPRTSLPIMPSSATSFSSDGSEDAGFEEGSIDVDMADEDNECIGTIGCIQTLTELEPTDNGNLVGSVESDEGTVIPDGKAAIPLPAPPVQVGSGAYGGNQAYLNINNSLPQVLERPSSPLGSSYWDSNDNRNSSRAPGDVGLNNIGNTCFMNSGLQCLLHTSSLVEYFVKSEASDKTTTSIVYQFHSLMKHAWFGYSNSIALHDFKMVLGNKYAQFKDCRQHDCQEFLAVLLDMLHEELKLKHKAAAVPADSSVSENASYIEDVSEENLERPSSTKFNSSNANEHNLSNGVQNMDSSTCLKNNNQYNPVSKRLKLGMGKEAHSTIRLDDQDDSREMKRKKSLGKIETRISQPDSATRTSVDTEDEEVDVENVENEAEGSSQEDANSVNHKNKPCDGVEKAQTNWDKYIQDNNTVVASTFQGMFKSSVTCSECDFVSETYEPFMYLSLPIPRVMEKQISATFISMKDRIPVKVDLSMHIMCTVDSLVKEVSNKVEGFMWDEDAHYAVAEVVNYRVARIVDDKIQIRNLCTNSKNIYVYELNENFSGKSSTIVNNSSIGFLRDTKTKKFPENWETDDNFQPVPSVASTSTFEPLRAPVGGGVYDTTDSSNGTGHSQSIQDNDNFNKVQCKICLEDFPKSELKQHIGCSCVLCEECLANSVKHFESDDDGKSQGGSLVKCAVCLNTVECKRAFISLEDSSLSSTSPELITIPIIFRNEPGTDANNNASFVPGLFGSPWMIRVPSHIKAADLIEYIESINPFPDANQRLLSVKLDGKSCGQCVFSSRCNGCEVPREGMISLNSSNSIMISYLGLNPDRVAELQPSDMALQPEQSGNFSFNRNEEPAIDIHDCLRTFSETEHLDEQNPWFCPKCKKNQRATKALSICRFPDYLIVYLKRFVFLDQASNKLNNRLTFPVNDLDVSDYLTEGFSTDVVGKYNLYSCVCHFGSASVGHYTAFAKNPVTNRWNYFNDDSISERSPGEAEYSSAYVLFYEKQGLNCSIPSKYSNPLPELNSFSASSSSTTPYCADTRVSSKSSSGPARIQVQDYIADLNLQVDSTSFSYPHASSQENLLRLEVDEGVPNEVNPLEIEETWRLPDTDSSVVVTSTSFPDPVEDADLAFDTAGETDTIDDVNLPSSSTTSQNDELASSSNGGQGPDSTSQE